MVQLAPQAQCKAHECCGISSHDVLLMTTIAVTSGGEKKFRRDRPLRSTIDDSLILAFDSILLISIYYRRHYQPNLWETFGKYHTSAYHLYRATLRLSICSV